MFIGALKKESAKGVKEYKDLVSFITAYITRKYKPYKFKSLQESETQYGRSWYIFFERGILLTDSYEDFVVRLSDHPVGKSRATSQRHIYIDVFDSKEVAKQKIDDFLNPGTPKYKYEKDKKVFEGTTLEKAIYPRDPKQVKHKKIEDCIRKNKKGECVNLYEIETVKPIFVGIKRPKWNS